MIITIDNYKKISGISKKDLVDFEIEGKIYDYKVYSDYLEGPSDPDIFQVLGLNKHEFLREAYGYHPNGGKWPAYHMGDYEAAFRSISAIFKKIEELDEDKPVPSKKPKSKAKFDGVIRNIAQLNNVSDFLGGISVEFVFKGLTYRYDIMDRYFEISEVGKNICNGVIFEDLGFTIDEMITFAGNIYGYDPINLGTEKYLWPEYEEEDEEAIYDIIRALYLLIEDKEKLINHSIHTNLKQKEDGKTIKVPRIFGTIRNSEKIRGHSVSSKSRQITTTSGHLRNRKISR